MTTSVGPEIINVSDEAAQMQPMSMSQESSLAPTTNSLTTVGPVWRDPFDMLPGIQDNVVIQLANGSFLVIYSQNVGNGRAPIFGQIFNPDGTVSGSRFDIVNPESGFTFNATNLQAVALNNGRVAIAWNNGNALQTITLDPYNRTVSSLLTISSKGDVPHVLTPNGTDGFTVVFKDVESGDYRWNNYNSSSPTAPASTGVSAVPLNSKDFDYTYVGGIDVNRNMYADLFDVTFNGVFLRSTIRIYAQTSQSEAIYYDLDLSVRTKKIEVIEYRINNTLSHGVTISWIDDNGDVWVRRFTYGDVPATGVKGVVTVTSSIRLTGAGSSGLTMEGLGDGRTVMAWVAADGRIHAIVLNNDLTIPGDEFIASPTAC
ncbi:hypothetical protein AAII07_23355 [Microvirga sp. 0TCS3.31]